MNGFAGSKIAGSPHVPACDRAPGSPFFGSLFDLRGCSEEIRGELGGRFQAKVGKGEAFADAEVGGGKDVGAAETEEEQHFDGPFADAADLGEVVDDGFVGHAANLGEGGDGAIEGFGGEVADSEGLVGGKTGGAEGLLGGVEKLFRAGMKEQVGWCVGRQVR